MRFFFSILLLFAFIARPAIQFSTIAYYQLNIDYIIQEYCVNKEKPELQCDGKCYLNEQLNETQTSSENQEGIILSESFLPAFYQPTPNFSLNFFTSDIIKNNWGLSALSPRPISDNVYHPPDIQPKINTHKA